MLALLFVFVAYGTGRSSKLASRLDLPSHALPLGSLALKNAQSVDRRIVQKSIFCGNTYLWSVLFFPDIHEGTRGRSLSPRSRSTKMFLSNQRKDAFQVPKEDQVQTFRILALHGKGGSPRSFRRSLSPLLEVLERKLGERTTSESTSNLKVQVVCDYLAAPLEGGKWWDQVPQGSRSYEALFYDGYEDSASLVRDAVSSQRQTSGKSYKSPNNKQGQLPYNLVIGHSQGAILVAAMIANKDTFTFLEKEEPPTCFIFNGVAWPNPFKDHFLNLDLRGNRQTEREEKVSMHGLFVVGDKDDMNPPEGARRVCKVMENAGMEVETLSHGGGHSVPTNDPEAVKSIIKWICEVAM